MASAGLQLPLKRKPSEQLTPEVSQFTLPVLRTCPVANLSQSLQQQVQAQKTSARPVMTTALGLSGIVGSAFRWISGFFSQAQQGQDVAVIPVENFKRRIIAADDRLAMPGAWRAEFDSCPQWIASPLARRDQPPPTTSQKLPLIPFPLALPPSAPLSESSAPIPEDGRIIQPHSKNPISRPKATPYVRGEQIFHRKAFIPVKKAENLIEAPPPPAFSRLSSYDPSRRNESPRLREIYRKARESSAKTITQVPKPLAPIKSRTKPPPNTVTPHIQEARRPETLSSKLGSIQSPSIHDVSMLDATPPSSTPLSPPQPHKQSPIDVDMPDAPPIKRVHWISGSAINGKLLACPPKHFYQEYMINEVPEDRRSHREQPTAYDMESTPQYDTPISRFPMAQDLSPTDHDESTDHMAELTKIFAEWRHDISKTPSLNEHISPYFATYLDNQLKAKQKALAAQEAYKKKIQEAAEEKVRKEQEEIRKADEALAALKLEEEAKKAKEAEKAKKEAIAAAKAAQAKKLIKPLPEEWKQKVAKAMATERLDEALTPPPAIQLTRKDFGTLLPQSGIDAARGWLNDEIVNRFLEHITERARQKEQWQAGSAPAPYFAFSSHWMTRIVDSGAPAVSRWGKRKKVQGSNVLKAKIVYIPICVSNHWTLLTILPQERKIEYLDSLGGRGQNFVAKAIEWLAYELKDLWKPHEWTIVTDRSDHQANGSDCGVFTIMNAFAVLRGFRPDEAVKADDMDLARWQIAATLLHGGCIGEFDWE